MKLATNLASALLITALVGSSGCASMWGTKPTAAPSAQQTRSQWWAANKKKAQFVPGQGYQLPGVAGYFDEQGRPTSGELDARSYQVVDNGGDGWELLDPAVAYKKVKSTFGEGPNPTAAEKTYQEAEALFKAKKFAEAAKKFKEAAERWPDSTVEADSLYMLAESYFFEDRYPNANDTYDELLKKHPGTRYLDQVISRKFAIGRYWEQVHQQNPHWPTTPNFVDKKRHWFDTQGHALKTYENIRLDDPTGPLADDALMATANSHFLNGRWEDADFHYTLLRKEYPDSEHQFLAHKLGLQAKLRCYQGSDYDGRPLEEAEKLVQQLLRQFPDKLGDDRERFEKVRGQIFAMRAQRDWELAEFYAKKESYGAAKYYYGQIVKQYPSTALAAQAQSRIAQYKGEPDAPAQKLEWLVNLFPDTKGKTLVAAQPEKSDKTGASDTVRR